MRAESLPDQKRSSESDKQKSLGHVRFGPADPRSAKVEAVATRAVADSPQSPEPRFEITFSNWVPSCRVLMHVSEAARDWETMVSASQVAPVRAIVSETSPAIAAMPLPCLHAVNL